MQIARYFFTAILSFSSLYVMASSGCCLEDERYYTGFYLGLAGGAQANMFTASLTASADTIYGNQEQLTLDRYEQQHHYQVSPMGEIYCGWGLRCACLYLGGRLGVNYSRFNINIDSQSEAIVSSTDFGSVIDNMRMRLREVEYTVDFKPGIVICNRTLLFALVGAALNKESLKATSHSASFEFNTNISTANTISLEKDKNGAGYRIGGGLEQMLSRCLSANLTFVYTNYWTLNRSINTTFLSSNGITLRHDLSMKGKAEKWAISAGLSYYF